jgi:hypothetical protein
MRLSLANGHDLPRIEGQKIQQRQIDSSIKPQAVVVDDLQENSVCTEHRPTIINEPRAALSKQKMSFQKLRVNSIQFSLVSAT